MMETIFINQKQVINLRLGLDLIDAAIIDYVAGAIRNDDLLYIPHPEGGVQYMIVSVILKTDLPLLKIKVRTIKEHLKRMVEVGVFSSYRTGYSFYYKPLAPFYKVTT